MACKVWLYALLTLPPSSEVVVTLSGATLTVMLRLAVFVAGVGVCESVTVTEKFDVPVLPLGVPEITPVPLKLKPAGKLPDVRLHVYDGTPPVACSVWLYATPSDAPGNDAVVMINAAGGFTVKVMACETDELPTASATLKVNDPLLAPVAVPVITPVAEINVNPVGRVPETIVHLYGAVPPDSASVAL